MLLSGNRRKFDKSPCPHGPAILCPGVHQDASVLCVAVDVMDPDEVRCIMKNHPKKVDVALVQVNVCKQGLELCCVFDKVGFPCTRGLGVQCLQRKVFTALILQGELA